VNDTRDSAGAGAENVPRILVVDDTAANAKLLTDLLMGHGYQAAQASSGADALAALAQAPYDVVLLDVVMPHMAITPPLAP